MRTLSISGSIFRRRNLLQRKFTAGDIKEFTKEEIDYLRKFIEDYDKYFPFMRSIKRIFKGVKSLSPSQWAGVANCLTSPSRPRREYVYRYSMADDIDDEHENYFGMEGDVF